MTTMNNEDPADPSVHEPRVLDAAQEARLVDHAYAEGRKDEREATLAEFAALLRAALDAETARWEEAVRLTWQMVDPLKPAGEPGSYWRGQDAGIVAALTTLRANLKRQSATRVHEGG